MKIIWKIIFILMPSILFAQNKQFFYEYKYIGDSTNRESVETEVMVLNINKEKSEFYSSDKFVSDSTLIADSQKGILSMPPNKQMNNDRIIKPINSKTINYITLLSDTKYLVSQKMDLKWNLLQEFDKVLDYEVQKATVEFGGRKWIAWFSKDIPIQDGPYKFSNLPGLILKIEDTGKNHIFELKGIRNSEVNFEYPDLNNFRVVKVTYPQFVKAYNKYRKNPMADSVGTFVDFTDANGVFHPAAETFRKHEKIVLARIAKENNIIELNLLKK